MNPINTIIGITLCFIALGIITIKYIDDKDFTTMMFLFFLLSTLVFIITDILGV